MSKAKEVANQEQRLTDCNNKLWLRHEAVNSHVTSGSHSLGRRTDVAGFWLCGTSGPSGSLVFCVFVFLGKGQGLEKEQTYWDS